MILKFIFFFCAMNSLIELHSVFPLSGFWQWLAFLPLCMCVKGSIKYTHIWQVCKHVNIYMHTYIYTYMYVYIRACMYIYIYIHTCIYKQFSLNLSFWTETHLMIPCGTWISKVIVSVVSTMFAIGTATVLHSSSLQKWNWT